MDPKIKTVIAELDGRIAKERDRMSSGGSFNPDDFALAAGPHSAGLLNLLIRTSNAQSIVEVGTSIGYTALWLGEAARATGGRVVGMEKLDSKHAEALDHIKRAGLDDIVEVRKGDAKEIVKAIEGPIDVAFLDAWKDDYFDYFDTLLPKMRVGGVIVADNITFPESVQELMKRYQDHVRAKSNVRSHFLSVGSGLEMSVKTAA
ncbi:MAG: class I SAM-dependent methyltransferase [Alphaproteobacteria bacterium]|nr:class I SAM-dependent methyltransferase [Alphaproteobacteria bacterium]